MVRRKQILFKSTQRNQGRLAQGGEIRGRGGQAAWEPGEGAQVAGKLENTGSGKAEVTPPPAYLWRGVLREQTAATSWREKKKVELVRKRLRGTERQVICVPMKEQGAGVNGRTQ